MTTMLTPQPPATHETGSPPVRPSGFTAGRLIKAELLKLYTTNTWWILGILTLVSVGLALLVDISQAHFEIDNALHPPDFSQGFPPGQGPSEAEIAQWKADWLAQNNLAEVLERSAANIFTAGQFFGLLFAMLFGTLMVTNEFHHQTATTTFLTTPKRTQVIVAKLAAAVGVATILWAVSTAINLAVGATFFSIKGQPNGLDGWPVLRAILLDLPAYAIWAVLGVGLAVLIRNQLGATITGGALYMIGTYLAQAVFFMVHRFVLTEDWVLQSMVLVPGVASQVMISPQPLQLGYVDPGRVIEGPQWWVGAAILLAYGIVAGVIGTLITRKRDIS